MPIERDVYPADPATKYQIECFLSMWLAIDAGKREEFIREFECEPADPQRPRGRLWVNLKLNRARTKLREYYAKAPVVVRLMFQLGYVGAATDYLHSIADNLREVDKEVAEAIDKHSDELKLLVDRRLMAIENIDLGDGS